MSQRMVGIVMDRLVADEAFRIRSMVGPMETLSDLHASGYELTRDDVDLFRNTNRLLRGIREMLDVSGRRRCNGVSRNGTGI